jgi:hypothetical protein
MTFPVFDPDTGGRQSIESKSKHDFALNSHTYTISIEATTWGNGVDFQQFANGVRKSVLREPPVKKTHCMHITLATGSYRVVPDGAVGVIVEIVTP